MHMIVKWKQVFFFTSLFLPFVRNYALDLVQKVMNEIWLESSQSCHAHDSSTETSNPNRTCCTLRNMPLYQLTPFMWLRVWFIPLCLTASIISQPYGVWFFSSKCRRRLLSVKAGCSLSEQERLKLKMHEALHIPLKIISMVPYSLANSPQDISEVEAELQAYIDVLHTHTPQNHTHKLQKRELPACIINTHQ